MTDAILVWSGKLFTNLIINGFSWRSSTVSHDRGSDLKAHAGWSTADEQLNKQQTYKVQSFSSKQQWQTLILRFAICFQQFDSEYTGSKVLGAGSQHCHPPGIRSHETRVTGEKQSKLERIWITEQLILSGATVQSRVARAAS
ncbi:uncharacterized protein [Setaria viridis]|uniref:uncharacterized protein isoform X1 n=1 Tax=Setaria viridis TaxID=4556 RepID=UPI0014933494|nr:uncharacterized protein LOC117857691 isoform X2 [Setaria viridis]